MRTFPALRKPAGLATMASLLASIAWAAPDTMPGVQVGEGGTLAVREMPVPKAGAGEVLIKVRAAGVNPVDWKAAGGRVGQVPGPAPDARQSLELGALGAGHEVPALQVLRIRRTPAGLEDAVEVRGGDRRIRVDAHVAA